jgi:hypothetical protein
MDLAAIVEDLRYVTVQNSVSFRLFAIAILPADKKIAAKRYAKKVQMCWAQRH